MKDYNYEQDLKIDKNKLDIEIEKQPQLFMHWAELWAESIYERDKLKETLDIVRAEIDSDLRTNFEEYGFDKKPTEAAISQAIVREERYLQANEEYAKTIKHVNILAGVKEAMNHKKRALENLVELYLSGYWSEIKLPTDDKIKMSRESIKRSTETLKKRRDRKDE